MKRQKKQLTDSQYVLIQEAIEATNQEWVRSLSWLTIAAVLKGQNGVGDEHEASLAVGFGAPVVVRRGLFCYGC